MPDYKSRRASHSRLDEGGIKWIFPMMFLLASDDLVTWG